MLRREYSQRQKQFSRCLAPYKNPVLEADMLELKLELELELELEPKP